MSLETHPENAFANDRAHVFHSWSAQAALNPLVIEGGQGSWIWDQNGKKYLDFSSQLVNVNIGHQHPKLVAGIQEYAGKLCTIAPFHANDARSEAARLIVEAANGGEGNDKGHGMSMVFFTNGGAEGNENAIRMARLHTGRHKILTTYRSYHGGTAAAIQMTGDPRRWPSEPSTPGIIKFWGPYPYRSAFHSTTEAEETQRALQHLADTLMVEGPHTVAAIVLETVVGTNGILVPPPGYLAGVRELCDRHGILLVLDEVMAGFARCGEWFAFHAFDVRPDLIVFAKGVNSGYLPLGGVVLGQHVAASFMDKAYPGGLTYSGHPLACASAVASINIFKEEGIVEHSRMLGTDVIGPELEKLKAKHPSIGDVRGMGTFWAIELVKNRETREQLVPFNAAGPDAKPMVELGNACKAAGLWPFTHFNRLHVVPPCNTPVDEVHQGLAIIDEALNVADGYVTA